jgi:RNA polymerase sigma factor (sigma-70 family)
MDHQSALASLRVLDGDTYNDWESVYDENVVGFYRLVYRKVGNRPDAEDLVAEMFAAALPHIRLPATVGEVRAYLLATARSVLADHWRRHYRVPLSELPVEEVGHVPTAPGAEGSQNARVHRLLQDLPAQFRRVLELRFLRGYSVRETAAEMGISVSNAKVIQFRALRRAAALDEDVT